MRSITSVLILAFWGCHARAAGPSQPIVGRTAEGIHYEVTGSGPPVILINGANLDLRMWADQEAVLARRFRVVRYDLRGYGRSTRVVDRPFAAHEDLYGV